MKTISAWSLYDAIARTSYNIVMNIGTKSSCTEDSVDRSNLQSRCFNERNSTAGYTRRFHLSSFRSGRQFIATFSCCIALSLTAEAANFTGYIRTGVGGNSKGGTQSCFKLPGAPSKYRLGNECEHYIEFALEDRINLADGSRLTVMGMSQHYNPYGHSLKFRHPHDKDAAWSRISQLFFKWEKMPALNGGNFWLGRRYYKRNSIHISDYYYWNQSATGFGFDEVPIGDLRYSYVFSRQDNYVQKPYINRHDFNVNGFKTNPGGELQVGLSYIQKPDSSNAHSGWALSAQHMQAGVQGSGTNTFALQYGRGPGTGLGFTGNPTLDDSNKSWRLVENLVWQITPRFSGQFEVVYQKDIRTDSDDQRWLSIGVRPVYALTEHIKLQAEVGRDQIKAPDGTRQLTKFTIAPAWSFAGMEYWARPELRVYYTYATWNKAAQRAADPGSTLSSTGAFGTDRHGSNFGAQLEWWWK
ncbi:maltoporin [Azomonas macrocytogenes]|uniref:Maltoporin n=1 Tax=Azomonas macrocytogenes TaxID=69962 RepID=A0A839T8I8_AZOMA|nr:carbohydrate porin [Azomonas macrocytogenes]MBB3105190.1 maltoporin [Azomonas macrocytogenes]